MIPKCSFTGYKALPDIWATFFDLIFYHFPLAHSASPTLASVCRFQHTKLIPASGLLHLLYPLLCACLSPIPGSELCAYVLLLEKLHLTILSEIRASKLYCKFSLLVLPVYVSISFCLTPSLLKYKPTRICL